MIRIEAFERREALFDAAADTLVERLAGGGVFIATGGSTPGPVYDRLSHAALPWADLTVTLTDERFVDPGSDDSNAKMVCARLLTGRAAGATFRSLKADGESPDDDALTAESWLAQLPRAAAVLMGVGEDGHVASLFPGAPELGEGLDLDGDRLCLGVARAGLAPFVPRITLTARALTQAALILLMVTGDEKRTLVRRALEDPSFSPPVAAFLRQDRCAVRVLWAA